MTANDLAALEAAHGLPLPGRYRELMLSYPFDAADPNAANALWSDARQIRAMNNEMRTGEFKAEWKADRFVIGCSPVGDTFFLDLTGASTAVFIWTTKRTPSPKRLRTWTSLWRPGAVRRRPLKLRRRRLRSDPGGNSGNDELSHGQLAGICGLVARNSGCES